MTFKQKIFQEFLKQIEANIASYQYTLNELKHSVANETKSTAGDKHETALSMLQIEQSAVAKHLFDAIETKNNFLKTSQEVHHDEIRKGSLVKTTQGYFFISVALPKIVVDNQCIIAISPTSPLGMQLLGKKLHDECLLLNKLHQIESIC